MFHKDWINYMETCRVIFFLLLSDYTGVHYGGVDDNESENERFFFKL